ncbi:MAG: hypothetical protein D6742_16370 [Cyanobacteria bacterium J069]|nr:MAG: hypothetical protein D6742_16370 [Cyanobacteria bacterium J069]
MWNHKEAQTLGVLSWQPTTLDGDFMQTALCIAPSANKSDEVDVPIKQIRAGGGKRLADLTLFAQWAKGTPGVLV